MASKNECILIDVTVNSNGKLISSFSNLASLIQMNIELTLCSSGRKLMPLELFLQWSCAKNL